MKIEEILKAAKNCKSGHKSKKKAKKKATGTKAENAAATV